MRNRDRQIRDPFDQGDQGEPIRRPEAGYEEIKVTFAGEGDSMEPVAPAPVVEAPSLKPRSELDEPTTSFQKIEWTATAPEQPTVDKLGNFEIQDVHAGADIVGDAVDAGGAGMAQPDDDGDGYYIITMENVVGDEGDGLLD